MVKEIYDHPSYWGKLSMKEADLILSQEPEGSYLFRHTPRGNLTTSIKFKFDKIKIQHILL